MPSHVNLCVYFMDKHPCIVFIIYLHFILLGRLLKKKNRIMHGTLHGDMQCASTTPRLMGINLVILAYGQVTNRFADSCTKERTDAELSIRDVQN